MLILAIAVSFQSFIYGQEEAIYEEALVPDYVLPDPLVTEDGKPVKDAATWQHQRRPELFNLFAGHVYGHVPDKDVQVSYEVVSVDKQSIEDLATQKQVDITVRSAEGELSFNLLLYIPNRAKGPVPAFLGLNFYGNHTIDYDPDILITQSWVRNNHNLGITSNEATESTRGIRSSRWPVNLILKRGYALGTIYYGDIDPDFDDGFKNGLHPLFYHAQQDQPADDEWGSIGAWAWGLSRALDYLSREERIDESRVAVIGHSRLGKASLWAGASDKRFALVISNNSGCGGAALSRRAFGETVKRINSMFPHWFCDHYTLYNDRINDCPVDQHQLIALMAPRPVYVASAEEDQWADPRGEFLSCLHADPVYELLGKEGLPVDEMPVVDAPVKNGTIGYHIRSGKHDITIYDWQQYLDFADHHLK